MHAEPIYDARKGETARVVGELDVDNFYLCPETSGELVADSTGMNLGAAGGGSGFADMYVQPLNIRLALWQASGSQRNFILPAKNLTAFFKYYDEYRALARPKGRTIVFGFSWTWRIPKPEPAKP